MSLGADISILSFFSASCAVLKITTSHASSADLIAFAFSKSLVLLSRADSAIISSNLAISQRISAVDLFALTTSFTSTFLSLFLS